MAILTEPADLGPIVREARIAKGWTQRQLADRCAVASSYITLIERGQRSASLGVVLNILGELDLTVTVRARVSDNAMAAMAAALLES